MEEILRIIIILVILIFLFFGITLFKNYLLLPQPFTSITGNPVGVASVNVLSILEITLVTDSVNFGNVTAGSSKNTTTDDPPPFHIRNDGSVKANVTLARQANSSALFSGTGGGDNTSSFQFKLANVGEGICSNLACTVITWTNVPGTDPLPIVCEFDYNDTCDEGEVELLINPPSDEPAGEKSESLVFTASES